MLPAELLDRLRRPPAGAGAIRHWCVHLSASRRISLGIKDRQIGNAHSPLTLGEACGAHYLFVWEDGRVSRGFLERRQLSEGFAEALTIARAAAYDDPDAAWVLDPAPAPDVELHEPVVARIARGDAGEWVDRLGRIRARMQAPRIRTWSGSFSAAESSSIVANSAGLHVESEATSAGWHVTINGEIGDGFDARRLDTIDELERRLEALLEIESLLRASAAPMAPGIHPVLLHPRVVESYVLPTLLHHLDGSTLAHGEGRFRIEDFGSGRAVLREDIGLRLDPLEPLRSGAYRCTSAGLPAAACRFVEHGRLIQPILDLKYARRLGRPPSPLPSAMDTLHLEGRETLTLERAIESGAGGAYVLNVLGVHTQDTSSGDFSLAAPQALLLAPRGFAGRLRATISGNLFEVLRDPRTELVAVEGETTPGLLFPCRIDPS